MPLNPFIKKSSSLFKVPVSKNHQNAQKSRTLTTHQNPTTLSQFFFFQNYPGKFLLSYLPRTRCKHEYVTVTAEGYRYRGQMFDSISTLFRWFKEHFRDAIPGTPSTPRSVNMRSTPFQPHTPNMLSKLSPNFLLSC